jgi:branched-chain amino acid transport system substrate-binding protein
MKKHRIVSRVAMTVSLTFCVVFLMGHFAMAADPVKVAILTDLSGPYSGFAIPNVDAAKMAIKDFGGKLLGQDIEFFARDHQSKADIGNQKGKELYEKEKVDAIFDCPNSAAALAVSNQALKNKKLFFSVSSGTTRHTGADCNRYTFDWAWNDYMVVRSVGVWSIENLGKKWYTITADYTWGHTLFKFLSRALEEKGATLLGNDMVAMGTADFSPYILNAIKAKPDVLGLLNGGKDVVTSTKQALEFGLKKNVKVVHVYMGIDEIKGAGPEVVGGDYTTAPWYWKVDTPGAKEWVDRWTQQFNRRPNWINAAVYSCITQYLLAVERAGTKDPKAVIKQLEGHTFNDFFANPGYIRPQDHMQVGKALILRAKNPEEIKEEWDYLEIVGEVPPEQAYMDPAKTGCKMGDF